MKSLRESLPSTLARTTQENSLSVYRGNLTTKAVIVESKKVKAAFPQLPQGFYDVLADRLKANKFTDQRLQDAVNHLVDNFRYPTPTIADIVSFDKRIKLYTYSQVAERVNSGRDMRDFGKIKDQKLWMDISEAKQHGFEHMLK